MYLITPEQEYVLGVLQKTKVMRRTHAYRLLKMLGGRNERYVDRCLEQLRHIRKIVFKPEDLITLPLLYKAPADDEMLSAIDVMLDLTRFKVSALTADRPPHKLCFLTEQDDSMGSYSVVIVRPGQEATVLASLSFSAFEDSTVIFLLSELSQKDSIKTKLPHYFATYDGGKYRYFEGGN